MLFCIIWKLTINSLRALDILLINFLKIYFLDLWLLATNGVEFQRTSAQQAQSDLRLSWGSFHGSYCSNIEQVVLTWALLFVIIMCISSNCQQMRGAFFWPIAFTHLCCDTQTRMRLQRGGSAEGQPQVTRPYVRYTYTEWKKILLIVTVFFKLWVIPKIIYKYIIFARESNFILMTLSCCSQYYRR